MGTFSIPVINSCKMHRAQRMVEQLAGGPTHVGAAAALSTSTVSVASATFSLHQSPACAPTLMRDTGRRSCKTQDQAAGGVQGGPEGRQFELRRRVAAKQRALERLGLRRHGVHAELWSEPCYDCCACLKPCAL
jgi:hypothetical protein